MKRERLIRFAALFAALLALFTFGACSTEALDALYDDNAAIGGNSDKNYMENLTRPLRAEKNRFA